MLSKKICRYTGGLLALALSLDCCQGLVNANLRDITVDNNNEPHVDSTYHRITGGKNLDANNWTVTIGSEKEPFNKKWAL